VVIVTGDSDEEFWDERYRSQVQLFSGDPNPRLVSQTKQLKPGTALDVGCGAGTDAIWLAEQGWEVTAVDISTVALERGALRAREIGADVVNRIDWVHEDLRTWEGPELQSYDLVSSQFTPFIAGSRQSMFRRLADAVAPGGTLLIVSHHQSDIQTTIPRNSNREMYFTASDVAESLDSEN
jgi:SAM-dependent methyltransferase